MLWRNSPVGELVFDVYIPMVIANLQDELSDPNNIPRANSSDELLRWYMVRTMLIQAMTDLSEDSTYANLCRYFEVDDEEDNTGRTPDSN